MALAPRPSASTALSPSAAVPDVGSGHRPGVQATAGFLGLPPKTGDAAPGSSEAMVARVAPAAGVPPIVADEQRAQVLRVIMTAAAEQNIDVDNLQPGDVEKLEAGLAKLLAG